MNICQHCQHKIHWDADVCPGCGAEDPHIDAEGLREESDQVLRAILLRLFFPTVLALLMWLAAGTFGVGPLWAAVIVWVAGILIASAVLRRRAACRTRQWLEEREKSASHEKLYAQFLEEHPALRSSGSKERHEAFRNWQAARRGL